MVLVVEAVAAAVAVVVVAVVVAVCDAREVHMNTQGLQGGSKLAPRTVIVLVTAGQPQAVQALGSLHDQPGLTEITTPELQCTRIGAYDQDDCT